jgi:glycosyltransferase involved in cell wall biosynthesis
MTSSGALVAPIYGPGGTRLKVLGAAAAMLPVVTTPTAVSGLAFQNNKSILIGETPQELANLTEKLFNDRRLYARLALSAKAIVERKYTWGSIAAKLDQVYQDVAGKKV